MKIRKYLLGSSKLKNKGKKNQYFPVLVKNYFDFQNKNNPMNSININNSDIKIINHSSSGIIFKRNLNNSFIKIDKINKKTSFKSIDENELNMILYRFKNYYNNLILITNKNDTKIEELQKIANIKERKLQTLTNFNISKRF